MGVRLWTQHVGSPPCPNQRNNAAPWPVEVQSPQMPYATSLCLFWSRSRSFSLSLSLSLPPSLSLSLYLFLSNVFLLPLCTDSDIPLESYTHGIFKRPADASMAPTLASSNCGPLRVSQPDAQGGEMDKLPRTQQAEALSFGDSFLLLGDVALPWELLFINRGSWKETSNTFVVGRRKGCRHLPRWPRRPFSLVCRCYRAPPLEGHIVFVLRGFGSPLVL